MTATLVANRLLTSQLDMVLPSQGKLSVDELLGLLSDSLLANPFIPHEPLDKQVSFLLDFSAEGFYGGTAGCGKTEVLLMGALQFIEHPGYHALLVQKLKRTPEGQVRPHVLLERAREWLKPFSTVRWLEQERMFVFPSGSTLTFGHIGRDGDVGRFGPYAYQYIGIDGLTDFARPIYDFLKGRLAYGIAAGIPLRLRVGSSPGGVGHEWVREQFVDPSSRSRGICFVPATPEENIHLRESSQWLTLSRLEPRKRLQLSEGDWTEAGEDVAYDLGIASAEDVWAAFQERYYDDPEGFVLDCIQWSEGDGPTDYQLNELRKLKTKRRLALRGPHGLGKTALLAWIILWFALTRDGRDWKCPCTASAWRQLIHYLFPELRKWAKLLRWERIGRKPFDSRTELLSLSLKLSTGEAFAVASDKAALIEGAHADELLYVYDEAKTIPDDTWDAAEGAFASGKAWAIAASTPGEPTGRFHAICSHKPGFADWEATHVTKAQCIAAGRMSQEWADQRKEQWGESSAVYQNRVEGDFASSDEDGVIPLSWIELANERWLLLQESGEWGSLKRVGVDVARSGIDKTVLAPRYDDAIRELIRHAKEDTMVTTGRVVNVLAEGENGDAEAVVDVIGIGAGVVDRLREQGKKVIAFNAAARTDQKDKAGLVGFTNMRSFAWWSMREILDPDSGLDAALPPDDKLTGDLVAPHWTVLSTGKLQIESKDAIKKRLGRSPDDGDAVVMAYVQMPEGAEPNIRLL